MGPSSISASRRIDRQRSLLDANDAPLRKSLSNPMEAAPGQGH